MSAFLRRLLALFRRGRLERDLEDELSFHLAMRQEEPSSPGHGFGGCCVHRSSPVQECPPR